MAGVGPAQLKAKVQRTRTARPPVNATITSAAQPGNQFIVIVKKSYTAPARLAILLKTDAQFPRSGTLDRFVTPTSGEIRFFRATTPGVEITFNGKDNKFKGHELTIGVTILAEGRTASLDLNDFKLTLTLLQSAGPVKAGSAAEVTLTAVSLSLDISPPRPGPPTPFTPLAQPPDPPPAPAAATDKWFGGATINTQDPGSNQRRAQLIVGQVLPSAFSGDLVLRQVRISATNTILALDNRAELFEEEVPGARQTPPVAEVAKSNPFEFNTSTILGAAGRQLFVEGRNASATRRDTGFQLGIKGIGEDGDRVALTVPVAPVITVDSPLVVVRKPHTSPARRVISIRASTAFTRAGTLTRSAAGPPIRLLDQQQPAAGTEIVVTGAGHALSAADLTNGVQFFAESNTPSGSADDYQLTLTLAPGPTPVAPPFSVTMTAVELTLDVALSRPSPGVAPLPMSANDKINTGRFVQVRDPGFKYERAMIILRLPNPSIPLTVVLESLNAQVQAFGTEAPADGQVPQPNPHTVPTGVLSLTPGGMQLFVEGTALSAAVRDTGFRYGIQGLENEADRVAMTTVQFDVTAAATAAAAASTFVRFGLWDNAFDPVTGNLLNGPLDANHFIGADSRRFFFRVHDINAGGTPQINWSTLKADGTNDHAPAAQPLPLQETPPGSHLFFSRPVFLVTDDLDRDLTGSGLAPAAVNLLTPRIRKVTIDDTHPLDGRLAATYSPAAGQILRNGAVWFRRLPTEERRRMRVHFVNVRSTVGGAGVLTAARRNRVKQVCRSIYGVCGIYVDFSEFQIDPPPACIGWTTNYPGQLLAFDPAIEGFTLPGIDLVPSASQLAIITAVRARPGHVENDQYLVFVEQIYQAPVPAPPGALVQGSRGESFPDSWVAAGSTARGFTFVRMRGGVTATTDTHELTHMTTNLRNSAGGHFDIGDPRDTRNLMHNGTIDNAVLGTKRLWDTAFNNAAINPSAIPRQINTIRNRRFVHAF